MPKKPEAYLWLLDHVYYDGTECLPWPFGVNYRGYGTLTFEGKFYRAPRLMCMKAHGEPTSLDLVTRHKCDNPVCVNPNHLQWGSKRENSEDMVQRGGHVTGIC